MAEETQQVISPVVDATAELTVLKQAHQEVLTKRQKDKARIAELEIAAIALTEKATAGEAAAHDALVNAPLRRMAATVSEVPEIFLSEFKKHFTVQADRDGNIAVTTLDGKRATDKNGKPVEFTPHSLYSLLASQAVVAGGLKDERSKVFAVLMRYFGASGAASISSPSQRSKPDTPEFHFGLR